MALHLCPTGPESPAAGMGGGEGRPEGEAWRTLQAIQGPRVARVDGQNQGVPQGPICVGWWAETSGAGHTEGIIRMCGPRQRCGRRRPGGFRRSNRGSGLGKREVRLRAGQRGQRRCGPRPWRTPQASRGRRVARVTMGRPRACRKARSAWAGGRGGPRGGLGGLRRPSEARGSPGFRWTDPRRAARLDLRGQVSGPGSGVAARGPVSRGPPRGTRRGRRDVTDRGPPRARGL